MSRDRADKMDTTRRNFIRTAGGLLLLAPFFPLAGSAQANPFSRLFYGNLPRNMNLKAFDPHRKDFVCKYEADAVPPIDPEADQWLQMGLALTSEALWADQRDYKKAVELWTKAAERNHWKAMLNLANAYAQGAGVPRDTEHAVQILEQAMKLGIPAAYDAMGTYHFAGVGVKKDVSRAYTFWELAADMGNPGAMGYLGEKLDASYDDPKSGFWGNRKVAREMLRCSLSQNNRLGAFELALSLNIVDRNYSAALKIFHAGVKFGSEKCANYLFGSFGPGDALAGNIKDPSRAKRYSILGDAIYDDSDLRFPNLDKILPLPPAPLPKWDGNEDTLIDAAKQIVFAPASVEGKPPVLPVEVKRKIARLSRPPLLSITSQGNRPCPRTGIWEPSIGDDHPLVRVFRSFNRQSYVEKGQPFPDYRDIYLNIDPAALQWRWLDNANEPAAVGTQITLSDLHDEQGRPLP